MLFTRKQSITPSLTLVATAVFFSCSSVAQNEPEHITVTGTRLLDTAIGDVSVLSRQDIDRINPTTTTDLLRYLPNVLVSQSGSASGQSYVSVRGGEENATLVLIDGVVVNDPTNSRGGGFDFNQIDPAAILKLLGNRQKQQRNILPAQHRRGTGSTPHGTPP